MTLALVFALTMVWVPVLAVVVQTASLPLTAGTRDAARTSVRRCALLAAALTVVVAGFAAAVADAWPLWVSGAAGFHVVWWIGARPLHRRNAATLRAEAVAVRSDDAMPGAVPVARRVASLVPREDRPIVPAAAWAVPVAVLVASAVAISWGALARSEGTGRIVVACALWAGAATFLAGWGHWARAQRRTSQDLSGAQDPAAAERLYDNFRRFMVRGIFVGTSLATLVFAGAAAAVVWLGDQASGLAVWVAAIGGSAVGVWGGVFGALADRQRRAIVEAGGVPPEPSLRSAARPPTA